MTSGREKKCRYYKNNADYRTVVNANLFPVIPRGAQKHWVKLNQTFRDIRFPDNYSWGKDEINKYVNINARKTLLVEMSTKYLIDNYDILNDEYLSGSHKMKKIIDISFNDYGPYTHSQKYPKLLNPSYIDLTHELLEDEICDSRGCRTVREEMQRKVIHKVCKGHSTKGKHRKEYRQIIDLMPDIDETMTIVRRDRRDIIFQAYLEKQEDEKLERKRKRESIKVAEREDIFNEYIRHMER